MKVDHKKLTYHGLGVTVPWADEAPIPETIYPEFPDVVIPEIFAPYAKDTPYIHHDDTHGHTRQHRFGRQCILFLDFNTNPQPDRRGCKLHHDELR